MAKKKTRLSPRKKSLPAKAMVKGHRKPVTTPEDNGVAVEVLEQSVALTTQRLLPAHDELKSLYQKYTSGQSFDEHDKAFYFVLDVGGVNRARQLIAHVEEVLNELEEFRE